MEVQDIHPLTFPKQCIVEVFIVLLMPPKKKTSAAVKKLHPAKAAKQARRKNTTKKVVIPKKKGTTIVKRGRPKASVKALVKAKLDPPKYRTIARNRYSSKTQRDAVASACDIDNESSSLCNCKDVCDSECQNYQLLMYVRALHCLHVLKIIYCS